MPSGSLNIAVLTSGVFVPAWQYQLLQHMLSERGLCLSMVIIKPAEQKNMSSALLSVGLGLLKVFDRLGRSSSNSALQTQSLHDFCNQNSVYRLSETECMAAYSTQRIDLLLNLENYQALPPWLCRKSRYGVWNLFIGSVNTAYSEWVAVREHAARQERLCSGVMAFTGETTGQANGTDAIFLTSSSMNQVFLSYSIDPVLWKMAGMLLRLLCQLRDSNDPVRMLAQRKQHYVGSFAVPVLCQADATDDVAPNGALLLKFLLTSLSGKWSALKKKLLLREQWVLLYGESHPMTELPRLIPPVDKFWADPQLVSYRQRRFVFFEEWVDKQNKGRIVCAEWYKNGNFSAVTPVLEEDYHLSYPHILRFQGEYYMIPESAENKNIGLYRCSRFPDRWEFMHNLMAGFEAFDATLHEYQGRWWMFVNVRDHESCSSDDLLYLYSADSPLSTQWHSHPCNPIVSDVASARPAGKIFKHGGEVYRPSQNCAGSYGRGLNLNCIVQWNEEQYQEKTVRQYIPDGKSGLYGLHTFSALGRSILSDGIIRHKRWNISKWYQVSSKA